MRSCGHNCAACGHCCAEVRDIRVPGPRLELRCLACGHAWLSDDLEEMLND